MATRTPTHDELLDSVAMAVLAPSVHNTQPWRFQLLDDGVEVFADPTRRLPVLDPDGRAMRVSCGAAVFNVRAALARHGYATDSTLLPGGPADLVARIVSTGRREPTPVESDLYQAIPRRHSNRFPFLDTNVPADVRTRLIAAAKEEGGWLDLILGPVGLGMVTELVRVADRTLVADSAYRSELAAWTRHDASAGDGVPQPAGGPAPAPGDLLVRRDFGGENDRPVREFETDPLVGVLGGRTDSPHDDVLAGQALQRVLLTATRLGLATSLLSQPIDVPSVREELRLGLRRFGPPQVLLRFGYGVPGSDSPRRPLSDVLLPTSRADHVQDGASLG